jgi:hypothetical protein
VTAYDDDIPKANVVIRALRERAGRRGTGNGLQTEVLGILEQNEDALHRVAAALLADGVLTAERVRELVKPPTASKN